MISLPESTEEIPSRYFGTFLEKISVYEPIKRMFWVMGGAKFNMWGTSRQLCPVKWKILPNYPMNFI